MMYINGKGNKNYATMSNWQRKKYLSDIINKPTTKKFEERDGEKDMIDLLNGTTIENNTNLKPTVK